MIMNELSQFIINRILFENFREVFILLFVVLKGFAVCVCFFLSFCWKHTCLRTINVDIGTSRKNSNPENTAYSFLHIVNI